ncbi:MAG: D-aminoacylase [Fimbriimonadaceae bacterium]|nr:D-aminoacylase [Fimbriimonadaceae bacterium]
MLTCLLSALSLGLGVTGEFDRHDYFIHDATLIDGSGSAPYRACVKVKDGIIVFVRKCGPEHVHLAEFSSPLIDGSGLVLVPGFIDAHSHADFGIADDPSAESQVRQGITTAVVGQDGIWSEPYTDAMTRILNAEPAINFAAFTGHGGIRNHVLGGDDFERWAYPEEIERMKGLVEADLKAGALGLSSGLEYNPGFFSNTDEVIELAKIAAKYKGSYISHVRNEDTNALASFKELIRIAEEAKIPAQISHIKLGLPSVWGQSKQAIALFEDARKRGVDVSADIYPYTYWQSGITVLTPSRDWDRIGVWKQAIRDLGDASRIRLAECTYKPDWAGKTIQEIADAASQDPAEIIQEIVLNTYGPGKSGRASVIVTAMAEGDIVRFMQWALTSFSSDGAIGGSHPRGAGSFPRVLGHYVRKAGVLSLEEAIRKMTSLPAKRFGFKDRGLVKEGMRADLVLFDPGSIIDTATPTNPRSFSKGIRYVIVNGRSVLNNGEMTSERPGQIITRTGAPFKPTTSLPTFLASHAGHVSCCGG